jgi:hypothetical protein
MAGYWDEVRQLRNQMRAVRRAPPLPERRSKAGQDGGAPQSWDEAPDAADQSAADVAALQERENELTETVRLVAELKDYAEQLENRVAELIAGAEPMAKVLRLPGVKTFLLTKFHPDKYPEADERQCALLTEAIKTINAAYARADALQTSE